MPIESAISGVFHHHAATFAAHPPTPHPVAPIRSSAQAVMPARSPDVAQALALGFGSLLLPVLGPMAWIHAGDELSKMQSGEVRPVDQTWLHTAKVLGMIASAIAASATIMLIVFALVV